MYRLFSICLLVFCLFWSVWRAYPSNELRVIICDVDQGDGIILTYRSFQMVIDAGITADLMLECLGKYLPFWDKHLEYVVATHADADHIGGILPILQRYRTTTVIANWSEKDTQVARQLYKYLADSTLKGHLAWRQSYWLESITINQTVSLQIISPPEENWTDLSLDAIQTETILSDTKSISLPQVSRVEAGEMSENDRSIAINVKFNAFSMLLTGDLECPGEIAMLARGVTKPANVLKIGHHGAKTSTCQVFIDKIQPEHAVISVGKNNRYQHPSPEVLSNLVASGARIWRTDQQGSVVITSDGTDYWVEVHAQ